MAAEVPVVVAGLALTEAAADGEALGAVVAAGLALTEAAGDGALLAAADAEAAGLAVGDAFAFAPACPFAPLPFIPAEAAGEALTAD